MMQFRFVKFTYPIQHLFREWCEGSVNKLQQIATIYNHITTPNQAEYSHNLYKNTKDKLSFQLH